MSSEVRDVVVVGGGPGGYVAALRAAQLGLSVTLVDRDPRLGGRCLREACVPAKAVLRSAEAYQEVLAAAGFGVEVGSVGLDFAAVAARRDSVIDGLSRGVGGLLRARGVTVVRGEARLTGPRAVEVGGQVIEARKATVIATGSIAAPLPGLAFGGGVVDTRQAWATDSLPASLLVVGAGASGAEVASAHARLGADVILIDRADQVLPGEDVDVSRVVHAAFGEQGIDVRLGVSASLVEDGPDGVAVDIDGDRVVVERVVVAAGRVPDLAAMGLDRIGVATDPAGRVVVDGNQCSSVEGLYAIGDICPGPALAHKASAEALVAAGAIAGVRADPVEHRQVPRVTFCHPNVASFGYTEAEARASGRSVTVGKVPYGASGAAPIGGYGPGLVKLLGAAEDGEILGAHIVGPRAGELLQQVANLRAVEGGVSDLARVVHSHPTLGEAVSEAARAADGWLIHG